MNTPLEPVSAPSPAAAITASPPNAAERFEQCVRKYPGRTLLAATGLGLIVVLAARALAPPPRSHAVQLLEDIQHRLASLAHTGYDRVSSMAEDSADAVSKGIGGLRIDRKIDKFSKGILSLFH